MKEVFTLEELQAIRKKEEFVLFYFSRPECGVCKAVQPKIERMVEEIPLLVAYYIDLSRQEETAGQYELFTIPVVLVCAGGKEVLREARNFSIEEMRNRLLRLAKLLR